MPAIEVQAPTDVIVKPSSPEIQIEQPKEQDAKEKCAKEGDPSHPQNPKAEPKELVFNDPFLMHDERNQQGMPNLPANDRTPQTRPRPESATQNT